jgi:hypothetical protein
LNEWERFGVSVDGAMIAREVLADIEAITHDDRFTMLSLVDASRESGFSAHALGQMVKRGVVSNAGRPNAPKILRKDLPKKPGFLQRDEIPSISRERIARSVANSSRSSDG